MYFDLLCSAEDEGGKKKRKIYFQVVLIFPTAFWRRPEVTLFVGIRYKDSKDKTVKKSSR